MSKSILVIVLLLTVPALVSESFSFLNGDMTDQNFKNHDNIISNHQSDIIKFNESSNEQQLKRYLIFGKGSSSELGNIERNYSVSSSNGFFSIAILPENTISIFQSKGFHVIEDFQLDFHSKYISKNNIDKLSTIGNIANSERVHSLYNVTGNDVKIAIIDTGVDFSNPDMQHSLARDDENIPIMLDADGQGIILTNATFAANIDEYGTIKNFTKSEKYPTTSNVYVKSRSNGVFLNIVQNGDGTSLLVYNSMFPMFGQSPLLNGTLNDDMKIGKSKHDYIESKSGIYHLGVMYQGTPQQPQVVPILVVDSKSPGIYDTVIPDMSTSWQDFINTSQNKTLEFDFDFTDDVPHVIGDGNEFLVYDYDDDGKSDYSVGTLGARVLDVYGVIENESDIDENFGAINGTLLPPIDQKGRFFGVMTDVQGHGTASAGTIVSKGLQEYDIYNDTKKYTIKGIAPDAKIIPVKALWFGDILYGWLWSAGFDNNDTQWNFSGKTRSDIISNSWGVSTFPNFEYAPGFDLLSLVMTTLSLPGSFADDYPGVLMVSSAGNSGHGYGTIGLPNASPTGISVGATTNNVFVGFGPFKDEPRFGNSTKFSDHVVDFSSRGPTLIGDPKPDLMSIGAYSFTPSSVTKPSKDYKQDQFEMFGGTSMSAPIVSGTAALVMQSLNDNSKQYSPFDVKNILMSTATDMENDVFTQGSGMVDSLNAVRFVEGEGGVFKVYNTASSKNLNSILELPLRNLNYTAFGMSSPSISLDKMNQTSWFGGRLHPGDTSETIFKIENPTNKTLSIKISPQKLELIEKLTYNGFTEPRLHDSYLNKTDVFRPNYIPLAKLTASEIKSTNFVKDIPEDSSLMVLNANFSFDHFMNQTNPIYADDLKISSLYIYDWKDKDDNSEISSDELSLVNRGGSWGTNQELRITNPTHQFDNESIVGIYPVPEKYSYWGGAINQNSTSMNYTLSASYFKKNNWADITVEEQTIVIPPKQTVEINAQISSQNNQKTGIYDGFLRFEGEHHTANVPVSYVIVEKVQKDIPFTFIGSNDNVIFGSEYVKGAFDMTNRYMAGDWRQYYLDIEDNTINFASIELSWENENTNFSAFVMDPQGKIIGTNMPTGVFGHFMNWASLDWLGSSPFSQGGGFFPVKNKDDTSTLIFAPINQTGTHSLLIHSTLFEGKNITEPITLVAKFSTLTADQEPPEIILELNKFLKSDYVIMPEIIDDNIFDITYTLDGNSFQPNDKGINVSILDDGPHSLIINAIDKFGLQTSETFDFVVDTKLPTFELLSKNNTAVSKRLDIEVSVSDQNLPQSDYLSFLLPTGERILDKKSYSLDTSDLTEGQYSVEIFVHDDAKNSIYSKIMFEIDNSIIDPPKSQTIKAPSQIAESSADYLLIIIIGVIAIVIVSVLVVLKQKSKIPQKN
ncbi:MAG: S8 family serine peptidase [Candidatus Nitrosopelagicus sp.]|nr:S8 family serine peptidase [Candidatus Nitrosopelagicus sp.]